MSSRDKVPARRRGEKQQPGGVRRGQGRAPDEVIRATIVVNSRSSDEARRAALEDLARQNPRNRRHLDPRQFARLYGASREDVRRVESFAKDSGFRVVESSVARRYVVVEGALAAFSRAFKVRFVKHAQGSLTFRSYKGTIRIPRRLSGVVEGVVGLDDRPLSSPHLFAPGEQAARHTEPREVAEFYEFPKGVSGKGQRVAVVELGGGFHDADIKEYFRKHRIPRPAVKVFEIDGQKNDPAPSPLVRKLLGVMGLTPGKALRPTAKPPRSAGAAEPATAAGLSPAEAQHAMWTVETTMDIQLIGAFANAAQIVVYFAPNTEHGKFHAITEALHNRQHLPTVISGSWGAAESTLNPEFVRVMDHVFQDAALLGVTLCYSSGDSGDGSAMFGRPVVQFPASSPHVLSCGGTHWVGSKSGEVKEVVWDERLAKGRCQSGGGVSEMFKRPDWQYPAAVELKTGMEGRGVPDVAGKADIETGYCMIVGGFDITMGGTSAAAPMWASLVALLNQKLGARVGYLNPFLYYDLCRRALREQTEGSNGAFHAGTGWNPCTGLGTPRGVKLLAALEED